MHWLNKYFVKKQVISANEEITCFHFYLSLFYTIVIPALALPASVAATPVVVIENTISKRSPVLTGTDTFALPLAIVPTANAISGKGGNKSTNAAVGLNTLLP